MPRSECESRIVRAVVYARGAIISRRVEPRERIPDNAFYLVIPGVSALAHKGSFRASVSGERKVLGLRSKLIFTTGDVELGPLSAKINELQLELRHVELMRSHIDNQRRKLRDLTLRPKLRGRSRKLDIQGRIGDSLAIERLADELMQAADDRYAELAVTHDSLSRELAAARVAAGQAQSKELTGDEHPTQEVIIHVAAGAAELGEVTLEYAVSTARWWPSYSVRLTDRCTRAEFSLAAFVTQLTLEDWSDVELSLATADMVEDVRLPELASLRLGRQQPARPSGFRPPPGDLQLLFEGYDRAIAEKTASTTSAGSAQPALKPEPLTSELLVDSRIEKSAFALPQGQSAPEEQAEERKRVKDITAEPVPDFSAMMMPATASRKSGGLIRGLAAAALAPIAAPVAAGAAVAGMAKKKAPSGGKQKPGMRDDSGVILHGMRAEEFAASERGGGIGHADEYDHTNPDDDWLDFDNIVLPAEGTERGKLVRAERRSARAATRTPLAQFDALAGPAGTRDPLDERGQFDHQYDASGTVDVPSNDRPHRVGLGVAHAEPDTVFRTVPVFDDCVFREALLPNPFRSPLLAGPIDVFIDGALAMTTTIDSVDRGGEIVLGLGVEERLRVARNVRVKESTSGLLGRDTHVDHHISIELKSALGHEATVVVLDRMPVTDDKEVTITRIKAAPEPREYDQTDRDLPVRGGQEWRVTVPAGGTKELTYEYRIEFASKLELQGGNRRD